MTPFAARLYKTAPVELRRLLAQSQFFEVSAIVEMADEMIKADVAAGCDFYSEFAVLPAKKTVVEFLSCGARIALLCEQFGDEIQYIGVLDGPAAVHQFKSGFRLKTNENLFVEWLVSADEAVRLSSELDPKDERLLTAKGMNFILEKMLCIINQPRLVERAERPTDKRILREARHSDDPAPAIWHQCRIRPGAHHGPVTKAASAGDPVMPLHYVRTHFKPSLGKWIEGFWRGDIALGLHLKWYSPRPPAQNERRIAA